MGIADRLEDLGLTLPSAPLLPPCHPIAFSWMRVLGSSVLVSGHGWLAADGSLVGQYARTAIRVAAPPLDLPVVVAAQPSLSG